jgi:hypothetical protein
MRVQDLVELWDQGASEQRTRESYTVKLPIHDAAKIAALAELYPGRSETQLITELLSAALDELEVAFPYVQGKHVVAEDELGDPVYEDSGLTPQFQQLTRKHFERLKQDADDG